jgi:hypothetical protein
MNGTTGFLVTSSALTHKGVAKGEISGMMLVRVSATLTFENRNSGKRWEEEVATHIVVDAGGSPQPQQFSEAEGLAWLKAHDEQLKQEEFPVEPCFKLKTETSDAELLEESASGMLMSGTLQLVPLRADGYTDNGHKVNLDLTLYAVGPVSNTIMMVTPDRTGADDAYRQLMQGQTVTVTLVRRRRRP